MSAFLIVSRTEDGGLQTGIADNSFEAGDWGLILADVFRNVVKFLSISQEKEDPLDIGSEILRMFQEELEKPTTEITEVKVQ